MDEQPYLDHVQLAAPPGCEAEARRFFAGLLGLIEIDKPPALHDRGGAWFLLGGGVQLHIGVTDAFAPAHKAHPALRFAKSAVLGAIAERLAAAGCVLRWADPTEIPGVERFFCDDPWGNRLELLAPAG